ncbi:MAG: hypothetical protein ACJ71W_00790 [Terriglobales bacterium]
MILRDVECFIAAKIFCWRKRRQTQREAKENRELRELAAELMAAEKAEREQKKRARIMAALPHPQLLRGPLVIRAGCDKDFMEITAAMHANFAAQGKTIVNADFEKN